MAPRILFSLENGFIVLFNVHYFSNCRGWCKMQHNEPQKPLYYSSRKQGHVGQRRQGALFFQENPGRCWRVWECVGQNHSNVFVLFSKAKREIIITRFSFWEAQTGQRFPGILHHLPNTQSVSNRTKVPSASSKGQRSSSADTRTR